MDRDCLLTAFRDYLNDDERFRAFIEACNRSGRKRGRLNFWQERLWDTFIGQFPEAAEMEVGEILDAFYVCHVHLVPLHPASIPIRKGLWCEYYMPTVNTFAKLAPYSLQYSLDSSAWGDATHIEVDHCDECVAVARSHGI
jgi:hypothetical protein